jgi:hypothetical protein
MERQWLPTQKVEIGWGLQKQTEQWQSYQAGSSELLPLAE